MKNATRLAFALAATVAAVIAPSAWAQEADLFAEKSGPSESAAGSDVTYSVTITNGGPDAADSVSLSDTPPASMSFVSVTQNTGPTFTCDSTVDCTIASLAAGESATFSIVFHIDAGGPGTTFTNFATASSETFDPNDENNVGVAATTIPAPQADLGITKDGPSAVGADTDVVYSITLTNGGPDPASNVVFTDNLPAPLTFVSLVQNSGPAMVCGTSTCTAATFAAGATVTLTLTGHVPPGTSFGTSIQNTATVDSDTADSNSENDQATTSATVSDVDISVLKTGPASVVAGTDASYTLTIANAGPDSATTVVLSDQLPPGTTFVSMNQNVGPAASCAAPGVGTNGLVSCSFATLANGASAQFTLVLNSGSATSFSNTATATTASFDTNLANNSSSFPTSVTQSADLSIVKTGPDPIVAGTNLTYTVVVTNPGPSNATSVAVSDTLPANTTFVSASQTFGPAFVISQPPVGGTGTITCTAASFAVGASATFSFVLHLDSATANGLAVDNIATVSAATPDANGANNSSTAPADATSSADLSVVKTGPDPVVVGTDVTYTVTVSNAGPSDAATVAVSDTLPAGTTFVSANQTSGPAFACTTPAVGGTGIISCTAASLAAGASAAFSFVLHIDPTLTPGALLGNTATVSSTTADPNGANGSSTTSATVSAAAVPAIPALSPLMLALLGLALAGIGALVLRSR